MSKNKKGMSAGKVAAIGAGVAAVAGSAYYLLGPNGKRHQKKVMTWMKKIEKEMESQISKVKNASKPIYHNTVDSVAAKYSKEYSALEPEIKALAKKLKGQWKAAQSKATKLVKKTAKKLKK